MECATEHGCDGEVEAEDDGLNKETGKREEDHQKLGDVDEGHEGDGAHGKEADDAPELVAIDEGIDGAERGRRQGDKRDLESDDGEGP